MVVINKNQKKAILLLCPIAVLLLFAVSITIFHYRPLIADSSTCAIDEKEISFPVYRRLLIPDDIYVRTPDRWFIINPKHHLVCEPVSVIGTFPYQWHKHDQKLGVDISDPIKQENPCHMTWHEKFVQIESTQKTSIKVFFSENFDF